MCFPAERGLYVRERNDGLYQVVTYLAAKMFDELAINAAVSVVIAVAAFYGIQLQGSFALFWLVYFCTLICGIGKLSCRCCHACWPVCMCSKVSQAAQAVQAMVAASSSPGYVLRIIAVCICAIG